MGEDEECTGCHHRASQHGLHRCMALLANDEPCPCGKGFKP